MFKKERKLHFKVTVSDRLFDSRIAKLRARNIGEALLPYLKSGDEVLDFGCGSMTVARHIISKKKVKITGVDVVDYLKEDFKFIKYDGGKLPFKNDSFDTVIAAFVLHHTENPEFYLKELKRVSRKKIILMEDTYKNFLEKALTYIVDFIANKMIHSGVKVPFNFKSISEWRELFKKHKLKLTKMKRFYSHYHFILPTRNVIMILKKR